MDDASKTPLWACKTHGGSSPSAETERSDSPVPGSGTAHTDPSKPMHIHTARSYFELSGVVNAGSTNDTMGWGTVVTTPADTSDKQFAGKLESSAAEGEFQSHLSASSLHSHPALLASGAIRHRLGKLKFVDVTFSDIYQLSSKDWLSPPLLDVHKATEQKRLTHLFWLWPVDHIADEKGVLPGTTAASRLHSAAHHLHALSSYAQLPATSTSSPSLAIESMRRTITSELDVRATCGRFLGGIIKFPTTDTTDGKGWCFRRGGAFRAADVVQQDSLNVCYFLSVTAAIADVKALMARSFPSINTNVDGDIPLDPNGLYDVALYVNGVLRIVRVDDKLPVDALNGRLAFSYAKHRQIWVSILEKAFAKIAGSYPALQYGSLAEAFELLTGCPVYQYYIATKEDYIARQARIRRHRTRVCNKAFANATMDTVSKTADEDLASLELAPVRSSAEKDVLRHFLNLYIVCASVTLPQPDDFPHLEEGHVLEVQRERAARLAKLKIHENHAYTVKRDHETGNLRLFDVLQHEEAPISLSVDDFLQNFTKLDIAFYIAHSVDTRISLPTMQPTDNWVYALKLLPPEAEATKAAVGGAGPACKGSFYVEVHQNPVTAMTHSAEAEGTHASRTTSTLAFASCSRGFPRGGYSRDEKDYIRDIGFLVVRPAETCETSRNVSFEGSQFRATTRCTQSDKDVPFLPDAEAAYVVPTSYLHLVKPGSTDIPTMVNTVVHSRLPPSAVAAASGASAHLRVSVVRMSLEWYRTMCVSRLILCVPTPTEVSKDLVIHTLHEHSGVQIVLVNNGARPRWVWVSSRGVDTSPNVLTDAGRVFVIPGENAQLVLITVRRSEACSTWEIRDVTECRDKGGAVIDNSTLHCLHTPVPLSQLVSPPRNKLITPVKQETASSPEAYTRG